MIYGACMNNCQTNIIKVDKAEGIVYGFAIVCQEDGEPYFDLQGDHISESVMRKASTDFMITARKAKEMHTGTAKGKVIHSLPLTKELAEALGAGELKKTGWVVGIKPDSDDVLEKYFTGEYTGFSIGGKAKREEVK